MSKDMSFEETLTKLEEAVEHLEQGDVLTLNESLHSFEESIRLARLCREKLDGAELRVRQLIEIEEDKLAAVPFEVEENVT